ncbi:glutathione S-transferase [Rhizobiales bacterium GAS191]|nr:glutathione S-transferase [Rhizobiales bacterium GAS113]SEE57088.1 glutathione S-transferase [Rhizobiales bacterium GAS191]
MAEFTVYGVPGSPYVRGALLGFEEKGVSYRFVAMPMGSSKTPEHLARHPFGRVPVVDHGDFRLYETQAILRYLDDLAPEPPLQPREPRARARMNQLVGINDCYFFPQASVTISFQRIVVPMMGGTPDEAKIDAAKPNAINCVRAIEGLMGDAYLAGDQLSIADLMLAPHIFYFSITPEGREIMKGGKLQRWIERMQARPSMQRTELEKLKAAA